MRGGNNNEKNKFLIVIGISSLVFISESFAHRGMKRRGGGVVEREVNITKFTVPKLLRP